MACSHSTSCPLFAQFQLNTTLRSWKIMYCDSDTRSRNCQRFKLSESGHTVPLNLLPNGTMLDIDLAPAGARECGPAPATTTTAPARREPATREPVAREPVAAPVAAVAVSAPATAIIAPAAAVPSYAAASPVPGAPASSAAPAGAAPAAAARARSILDRILGRKA